MQEHTQSGTYRNTNTNERSYEPFLGDAVSLAEVLSEQGYEGPFTVVDVGSSTGEALDYFNRELQRRIEPDTYTVSLDVDPEVIEENRTVGNSDECIVCPGQDIELEDDYSCFTICLGLLNHLSPEDRLEIMGEIQRVTKPEGLVAFEFMPGVKEVRTPTEMENMYIHRFEDSLFGY